MKEQNSKHYENKKPDPEWDEKIRTGCRQNDFHSDSVRMNERSDGRVVCFREEAVRPGESHLPESLQLVRQPPQGDQETGQHW